MKKLFIASLVLLIAAVMIGIKPAHAHPTIDIVASNWKFTPATISIKVGEAQELRLTSAEGVHGMKSDELGIPQTLITPGKLVTVSVTPKKAGTYVIPCSVICGAGHPDMKLTVKVEP